MTCRYRSSTRRRWRRPRGFATDHAAAEAIASGDIALRPAQDAGIVTPLAFVAGPSMYGVAVVDANNPARRIAAPLNDGPPAACAFWRR